MASTQQVADAYEAPALIEIEPTFGCNLRCKMCHVPTHADKKPQFLDIERLAAATTGIENCHIILGSEYEPTIHPDFDKLLRLIVERNWKVDFLSNCTRLHLFDQGLLVARQLGRPVSDNYGGRSTVMG